MQVVSDQIRLWQKESERVTMVPAFMYSEFENDAVWRDACDSARSLGGHMWQAVPHPPSECFSFYQTEVHPGLAKAQDDRAPLSRLYRLQICLQSDSHPRMVF